MNAFDLHYGFLCACLGGLGDQAKRHLEDPRWNWEHLIRRASTELVLPVLYAHLRDLGLHADLPNDVADFLSGVEQLSLERNQLILSEARTVTELLNGGGIEPVLLKGAAHLISGVYRAQPARFLADVDLLVPESHFTIAVAILIKNGYCCEETNPIELGIGHAYPPLRRPQSVEIDLHRSMGAGICNSLLPTSEVLGYSVSCEFQGVRLRIPSPEHLVAHHVMHLQIHDSYRARIRPSLRALVDIIALHRRFGVGLDWAAIEKRFTTHGRYGALAMHLLQVEDVLGFATPIPIHLTPVSRLRWWRRKALWRLPYLKFVDPFYFSLSALRPRMRRMSAIIREPGGWKDLLEKLFKVSFYVRLLKDL